MVPPCPPLPPITLCEGGGGLDFLTQQNLAFFKIKGGEKRDKRGIFEIFIGGGELLEMKLQTENKISK